MAAKVRTFDSDFLLYESNFSPSEKKKHSKNINDVYLRFWNLVPSEHVIIHSRDALWF